jgi:hypothetical protein
MKTGTVGFRSSAFWVGRRKSKIKSQRTRMKKGGFSGWTQWDSRDMELA